MSKFLCGECIHNSDKGGGCLVPQNLGYVDNCNHYLPKDRPIEQTNEEWFCGLSTEEKAKVLRLKTYGNNDGNKDIEQGWEKWFKSPHQEKPLDIPSVPNWDEWLKAEKAKCALCGGTENVECSFFEKFECPYNNNRTNEEWIHSLNTEQLAEWLYKQNVYAFFVCRNDGKVPSKEHFVEWLKEVHQ